MIKLTIIGLHNLNVFYYMDVSDFNIVKID